MKILHLITRLILGGAQENTVLSCEGLAARGHEVILAHGPIYGPEGSLQQRAGAGGYEVVELPGLVRPLHPIRDPAGYRQCRALIRRLRPDVVHTHSSKAGILGRAAAWAERVPAVVHTVHGLPFHPYQSRLAHRLYVAAERWAARRCHRIVCVADAMAQQALGAGVGEPQQYRTILSGLEVERFLEAPDPESQRDAVRKRLGIGPTQIVVGTVARLAELKGHDDLLDALEPLLRERPDVSLLWVGDGWWRRRLEARIRRMGLEDRVVITGLVPPDQVPAHMRAMDLLVHPSYREGLARTLPQALLCGTAVVSYDCDGAGEVCVEMQTGRLVPTGDRSALREAVAWMVAHPDQRLALARAGRARCRRRFDARVMVEQLEVLYEQLLEQRRPAPTPVP